jgi:hypothetical protein
LHCHRKLPPPREPTKSTIPTMPTPPPIKDQNLNLYDWVNTPVYKVHILKEKLIDAVLWNIPDYQLQKV